MLKPTKSGKLSTVAELEKLTSRQLVDQLSVGLETKSDYERDKSATA